MALATAPVTFNCIDSTEYNAILSELQNNPKYSNIVGDLANLRITATFTDSP